MGSRNGGVRFVLTADRSLMSTYHGNIYQGFVSCLPRNILPDPIYYKVVCPPLPRNHDGTVSTATLAMCTVEAILRRAGLGPDEIVIADPWRLHKVVGPNTEYVGISVEDPLGIGPATTGWSSIFGGTPHNRIEFLRLMGILRHLKEKYPFTTILGGPGSWQVSSPHKRKTLGIDLLVEGEAEYLLPDLINGRLKGLDGSNQILQGRPARPEDVPPIHRPAICNLIEVSRGCGRGCRFCAPTISGMLRSIPLEKIEQDARMYVRHGIKQIIFASDDTLRYGSRNFSINEEALLQLYETVFNAGIRFAFISHASLANFAEKPEFIAKLTRVLRRYGHKLYGCQPGIETGSPYLMEKYMKGKCRPFRPQEWPEVVYRSIEIMNKNGWVPCCTLIMGLPDEERADIRQTIELIKRIDKFRALYIPLFFVPMEITKLAGREKFIAERMITDHRRLLLLCWKHNLRHIDYLYRLASQGEAPLFTIVTIRSAIRLLKFAIRVLGPKFLSIGQVIESRLEEARRAHRPTPEPSTQPPSISVPPYKIPTPIPAVAQHRWESPLRVRRTIPQFESHRYRTFRRLPQERLIRGK